MPDHSAPSLRTQSGRNCCAPQPTRWPVPLLPGAAGRRRPASPASMPRLPDVPSWRLPRPRRWPPPPRASGPLRCNGAPARHLVRVTRPGSSSGSAGGRRDRDRRHAVPGGQRDGGADQGRPGRAAVAAPGDAGPARRPGPAAGHQADGPGSTVPESWMRVEFTGSARRQGSDDGPALEAALHSVMDDVRAATVDYDAMLALLRQCRKRGCGRPNVRRRVRPRTSSGGSPTTTSSCSATAGSRSDTDGALVRRRWRGEPRPAAASRTSRRSTRWPTSAAAPHCGPRGVGWNPTALARRQGEPALHRAPGAAWRRGGRRASSGRDGVVTGVRLFYGLFAATAYNRNPRSIPMLAQKVDSILAACRASIPASHDGRALRNTLDTWPRDELFQAPEAAIIEGARRALDLRLRPRAAAGCCAGTRSSGSSRPSSGCRATRSTRGCGSAIGAMLARAFAGHVAAFYIALGDEPLARVNYIIGTVPGEVPHCRRAGAGGGRPPGRARLPRPPGRGADRGGGRGRRRRTLIARWSEAFPAAYREQRDRGPGRGIDRRLGRAAPSLSRRAADPAGAPARRRPGDQLTMWVAQPGAPMPLADTLPLLESLDLRAIQEVPYDLDPTGAPRVVLQVFSTSAPGRTPCRKGASRRCWRRSTR